MSADARRVLKRARLERERQQSGELATDRAASQTRIQSPIARYDAQGRLQCALCRVPVKSEHLWQAHLASRAHQTTVEQLRQLKAAGAGKRAPATTKPVGASVIKRPLSPTAQVQAPAKRKVDAAAEEEPESREEGEEEHQDVPATKRPRGDDENEDAAPTSALPAGFFDADDTGSNVPSSRHGGEGDDGKVAEKEETPDSALPAGFFDDTALEVKVRQELGGEHADIQKTADGAASNMDVEWERFQSELGGTASTAEKAALEDGYENAEDDKEGADLELDPAVLTANRWEDELAQEDDWRTRLATLRTRVSTKLTVTSAAVTAVASSAEALGRPDSVEDEDDEDEDSDSDLDVDLLAIMDWRAQQLG
ncbi:hypothetical protein THASP1DRAFT_31119 [Thamnocephalis sphaerospora]|uniref:C2H2-type domain-containing protein n=1 Tax=Thamnocephalis sphaerospora TaxID=78915 RepID=A0A4P9XMC5_9FUNG|nr:hypothetical protein THASP1DRAFT_31557 [Thamnocephalis sphaerospora]RKP07067.1 hypothetical protein THASP1DRAFT_31119 [Thamnocephalis sphaerospora]|eukprot:RKP06627.1 hypothetical protein THASP1DRAFT_31557 [Thamnocephalis sphaerospora]